MYCRIVGMVLAFLGCLSAGLTLPASAPSVTLNDLHQRGVRQATDSGLREVIQNCTENPNATDSVILDCLLPEFLRNGKCSPLPACTPKTLPDLVTQYRNMEEDMVRVPEEEKGFILSEIPTANGEGTRYVGFPNKAFIASNLHVPANSSCFPRSFTPVNLGENYFPSVLLVVSECTTRQSCVNCQTGPLEPDINNIPVLKRAEDGCEEDGTENWMTKFLKQDDLPSEEIKLMMACSCV